MQDEEAGQLAGPMSVANNESMVSHRCQINEDHNGLFDLC